MIHISRYIVRIISKDPEWVSLFVVSQLMSKVLSQSEHVLENFDLVDNFI